MGRTGAGRRGWHPRADPGVEARPAPERGRRRRRARPNDAALTEGIDLALANKESLVIGGELVMALAEATGARIIPVDSEHSALFQLIGAEPPGTVDQLVLTASGGPFRGRTDLSGVTREEALAHPTWEMGGRITIDSSTLMNKGFEMIEAHHLFGVPLRAHRCCRPPAVDRPFARSGGTTALLAHSATPTCMCRSPTRSCTRSGGADPFRRSTWRASELTLCAPDLEPFACLRLARQAAEAGGRRPACSMPPTRSRSRLSWPNGSPSPASPRSSSERSRLSPGGPVRHFEDLFDVDEAAREHARGLIEGLAVA